MQVLALGAQPLTARKKLGIQYSCDYGFRKDRQMQSLGLNQERYTSTICKANW